MAWDTLWSRESSPLFLILYQTQESIQCFNQFSWTFYPVATGNQSCIYNGNFKDRIL